MGVPITPAMSEALILAQRESAVEKVEKLYAAELDFHTAAAESIRLAKDAVTDFRIEELRAKLNALVEQNAFSIGKFLVDLMLQIAFGPVLGSVMGRAAGKQMSAVIYWRKMTAPLDKLLARAAKRTVTQAEAAAQRKIFKVWANAGRKGTPVADLPEYRLSDFQTGIVVDSFQAIGAAIPVLLKGSGDVLPLGKVPTALTNPSQDLTKDVTIDAAVMKYVPTILESINENADNYLLAQRKTAFEQQKILRAWIAEAETADALTAIHAGLDRCLEAFADQEGSTRARRQLRNLSKMLGLLLFKGDPARWSKLVESRAGYRTTQVGYDITWPEELQVIVLNSVWIPGTEESYYHRYLKIKQFLFKREEGEGIDERSWDRSSEPPIHYPSADPMSPGNLGSTRYTALDAAFWHFQKFMEQFYKDLTSERHDAMFKEMLRDWGYAVSR